MRLDIILRKGLYNNREFPCVSFVISCRLVKHEPATWARQSTYWKPFCFQLTNRGKSRVGDSSGRLFWNVNCIINHFTILARLQLYFDTYKFQPHFSVFHMHIFFVKHDKSSLFYISTPDHDLILSLYIHFLSLEEKVRDLPNKVCKNNGAHICYEIPH